MHTNFRKIQLLAAAQPHRVSIASAEPTRSTPVGLGKRPRTDDLNSHRRPYNLVVFVASYGVVDHISVPILLPVKT